jgi:hypothetical protein
MTHSWSHDAYYGHTLKSRAQITILEGNYFQGGLPQGGDYRQAENYLVNIPNGGILKMFNNILVKNESGANSNGASVTFYEEGFASNEDTARPQSVDIENNIFVALSRTYDGGHPLWPFFFWHDLVPGTGQFEVPTTATASGRIVPPVTVSKNVFVGYCPQTYAPLAFMNYRGDLSVTKAFSELYPDFSTDHPVWSEDTTIAGMPAYAHETQSGVTRGAVVIGGKTVTAIGAEDQ